MQNSKSFTPGHFVQVAKQHEASARVMGLVPGRAYRVLGCRWTQINAADNQSAIGYQVAVEITDDVVREFGSNWFVYAENRPEPTVSFRDLDGEGNVKRSRVTAREYAARAAKAKKLDKVHRDTLKALAAGEPVGIMAAQDAIVAGFSTLNRFGASTDRAEAAKELRHLYYIVGSGVRNLVMALPVIDEGSRSPRIAELERLLKTQTDRADAAERTIEHLDKHADGLAEARDKAREDRDALEQRVRDLEFQADARDEVIRFAMDFLSDAEQAEVKGYTKGFLAALRAES